MQRNTRVLMKVVIPDSRILETPGKILSLTPSKISKAIDMIVIRVRLPYV